MSSKRGVIFVVLHVNLAPECAIVVELDRSLLLEQVV